jgi:hypothetical protein
MSYQPPPQKQTNPAPLVWIILGAVMVAGLLVVITAAGLVFYFYEGRRRPPRKIEVNVNAPAR